MILITGAAGKTGLAVLKALADRGATARALIRRPEQEAAVRDAGATEVVIADLYDKQGLTEVARGAAAVYHICPNVSPDEVTIGGHIIAAASHAGVPRFVFHSVLHPQAEAMPHHGRKLRVEELLFETDFEVTILQPTAYMQNLLAHWRTIVEDGIFPVPYGLDSRLSLVDLEDVAEVAAKVLTETGHSGAVYELCGHEALDQREVAAELTNVLGRSIRAVEISPEDWERQARAAGLDDDRRATLLSMFRYYDRHGMVGNANALRWLLGREPTSLRGVVRRVATGSEA